MDWAVCVWWKTTTSQSTCKFDKETIHVGKQQKAVRVCVHTWKRHVKNNNNQQSMSSLSLYTNTKKTKCTQYHIIIQHIFNIHKKIPLTYSCSCVCTTQRCNSDVCVYSRTCLLYWLVLYQCCTYTINHTYMSVSLLIFFFQSFHSFLQIFDISFQHGHRQRVVKIRRCSLVLSVVAHWILIQFNVSPWIRFHKWIKWIKWIGWHLCTTTMTFTPIHFQHHPCNSTNQHKNDQNEQHQ